MADQTTFNAETGEVVTDTPVRPSPMARMPTSGMPSLINIPPQIAVTVFWMAVGFGIAWWVFDGRKGGRRDF